LFPRSRDLGSGIEMCAVERFGAVGHRIVHVAGVMRRVRVMDAVDVVTGALLRAVMTMVTRGR
jgi:hypothetical protein